MPHWNHERSPEARKSESQKVETAEHRSATRPSRRIPLLTVSASASKALTHPFAFCCQPLCLFCVDPNIRESHIAFSHWLDSLLNCDNWIVVQELLEFRKISLVIFHCRQDPGQEVPKSLSHLIV